MTKGGTWAGALECAAKNLSRLVVRKSDHAFRGNSELINKLKCLYINEERIFPVTDLRIFLISLQIISKVFFNSRGRFTEEVHSLSYPGSQEIEAPPLRGR